MRAVLHAHGLRLAAPCGARTLGRVLSLAPCTGRAKLAAAAPAWLRRRSTCSSRIAPCAAADDGRSASGAPAENALQSHPLTGGNDLAAPDAAGSRTDDALGPTSGGLTVEAADEDSPVALSATTQAMAVPAEPLPAPRSLLDRIPGGAPGRLAAIGVAGFVGLTFVVALVRGMIKMRSPKAKRIRNINKNKLVVDSINRYLPQDRAGFGKAEVRGIKMRTGFSGVEVFRKYLWYLLRERSFDVDAVADLQQLKEALGLTDDEVAEALKERAERIYKEYGNVMLETEGMTKGGIERKATCRSLFSKLQFLAESEELLQSPDAARRRSLVADVFGATEDDASQLRIVSLYEVDAGRVEELASEPSTYPEDPNAEE